MDGRERLHNIKADDGHCEQCRGAARSFEERINPTHLADNVVMLDFTAVIRVIVEENFVHFMTCELGSIDHECHEGKGKNCPDDEQNLKDGHKCPQN